MFTFNAYGCSFSCEYAKRIDQNKKELKPLSPDTPISQKRQIKISKLLYKLDMPAHAEDIHIFIYDYLKTHLDNFELADELYGLEILIPRFERGRLKPTFEKKLLTDDKYYLNYIVLKLEKELINV